MLISMVHKKGKGNLILDMVTEAGVDNGLDSHFEVT